MAMMTKQQYMDNPCRTAAVPYWKAVRISLPNDMKILHDDEWNQEYLWMYQDEPYFRLRHDLQGLESATLPTEGFSIDQASIAEYADHINGCYESIGITAAELKKYMERAVYCPELWLALRHDRTGKLAATGIGELDREIGEGVLEWIQVSEEHRCCGLGSYLVSELLWRMKDKAKFVTVSGQCNHHDNPEALYRRCGFTGNDIWHILKK